MTDRDSLKEFLRAWPKGPAGGFESIGEIVDRIIRRTNMSNFRQAAYHPTEMRIRTAWWLDNYFKGHEYGVQFDDKGPIYRPGEVRIPLDVVFVPEEPNASAGRTDAEH